MKSNAIVFTVAAIVAGVFLAPSANANLINNGELRFEGDQVWDWGISGSGTFTGDGQLTLGGILDPGNSPGMMSFGVNTLFSSTSRLNIEVSGVETAGVDYDALRVLSGRNLMLGGTLSLNLLVPETLLALGAGSQFNIITADEGAQILGAFDAFDFSGSSLGGGQEWEVSYTSNAVTLGINDATKINPTPPVVPEPATMSLLALGLSGLVLRRRMHG